MPHAELINRPSIAKLKATSGKTVSYSDPKLKHDPDARGIRLMVGAMSKTWVMTRRIGDKVRTVTLGPWPELPTVYAARDIAKEKMLAIATGTDGRSTGILTLRDAMEKVPVLILSATIKRSMVEAVLPVDDWVSIEIEKHKDAKVSQVVVNASKASLLYGTGDRPDEYGEVDRGRIAEAEKFRADVQCVSKGRHLFSYKSLMDEGVDLAGWFNSVEGLNDWAGGRVDILGRPLPEPQVVEDIARAIHQDGEPIAEDGLWYNKRPVAMVGEKGMAWCERHRDARVEDIRWVLCEGAMMQAAARSRHVRQGCEVRLFTNMVLPIKVDEVVRFDDLLPEEQEYRLAPIRVASPALAKQLFARFDGMSTNAIKQAFGNLHDWAAERDAELIEVRLQGKRYWSRVLIADGGWRYLCDRVPVVDWRDVVARADDNPDRIEVLQEQTEHARDVMTLREAFEREAWHDEDGVVPEGTLRIGLWDEINIGAMVVAGAAVWPWRAPVEPVGPLTLHKDGRGSINVEWNVQFFGCDTRAGVVDLERGFNDLLRTSVGAGDKAVRKVAGVIKALVASPLAWGGLWVPSVMLRHKRVPRRVSHGTWHLRQSGVRRG